MNDLIKRITTDNQICNGKPIIRGYRITVQTIMEFVLAGTPENEILEQYPMLEKEDIEACKAFSLLMLNNKYTTREIVMD